MLLGTKAFFTSYLWSYTVFNIKNYLSIHHSLKYEEYNKLGLVGFAWKKSKLYRHNNNTSIDETSMFKKDNVTKFPSFLSFSNLEWNNGSGRQDAQAWRHVHWRISQGGSYHEGGTPSAPGTTLRCLCWRPYLHCHRADASRKSPALPPRRIWPTPHSPTTHWYDGSGKNGFIYILLICFICLTETLTVSL